VHGNTIDYDQVAVSFRERRYLVVKHFLPEPVLQYLKVYCGILRANNRFRKDNRYSLAIGGDPVFDAVLCWLSLDVSRLVGFDLAPTFSYAYISAKGDARPRRRNRAGSEISVAVSIEVPQGAAPSVLHLRAPSMLEAKVEMSEGDGCVFDEAAIDDCREPVGKDGYIQLFLHFVDGQT
jgi:hypothetical protein